MAGKYGGKTFKGFVTKVKAKIAAKKGTAKKAKNIAGCSKMTGICKSKRKKSASTKPSKFTKRKTKFRPKRKRTSLMDGAPSIGGGGGGGGPLKSSTRYKNVRYI